MKRKFTISFSTHNVTDIEVELDVPEDADDSFVFGMIQRGEIDWLEEINQQHTLYEIDEATHCEHRELLSVERATPPMTALREENARLKKMLKIQEDRLHAIEEAIDGWSTEPDTGEPVSQKFLNHEDRLQKVQEACPWDDDNEHDSWYFPPKK